MVVLNKKGFKLPYIDREKFILLMRLGCDRNQSSFYIKNYNNINRLVDTISGILDGEKVTFLQNCLTCGKDFACSDCKYCDLCTTRDLPFQCICPQCLKDGTSIDENAENNDL
ncbi:MAG: hypothetical protein QG670_886 [Thermoproteota archaeon]|nr:hypothetical protein [Thermoproteota archaeon]